MPRRTPKKPGRSRTFLLRLAPLASVMALLVSGLAAPSGQGKPVVEGRDLALSGGKRAAAGFRRVVEPPIPAHSIGFSWENLTASELRVRLLRGGSWSDWLEIDGTPDEGPDFDSPEHDGRTWTDPLWLGYEVQKIDVELTGASVENLRMHIIRSEKEAPSSGILESASALPPQPWIISRAEWGADETWRDCTPTIADTVRYSIVHHTATSNDYPPEEVPAILRSIYHHHRFSRGFCDIGYNFLVDKFGRVFEGRYGGIDKAVQGAHAAGFNYRSTGLSVLGNFVDQDVPPAAYSGLRSILAWKLALHRVDANQQIQVTAGSGSKFNEGDVVTLWTISGHKDVSATACPARIYDLLPRLREEVKKDIEDGWWERLGGYLTSSPDAASFEPGRLDIFARGGDGAVWSMAWLQNHWTGWGYLGGYITSDPSAVSWGPGRYDVFVRGGDGALWHRAYESGWGPWEPLGGFITSGPDAASFEPGKLSVFARGGDGAIWQRSWNNSNGWSAWSSLGGYITSDPTVASWNQNQELATLKKPPISLNPRLDLFARGGDSALWQRSYENGSWSAWSSLGGILSSGPDASASEPGKIEVFARGADDAIWVRTFAGGWSGWSWLGGTMTSDPTAASWGPGRIDVFARDGAMGLRHRYHQTGWNQ